MDKTSIRMTGKTAAGMAGIALAGGLGLVALTGIAAPSGTLEQANADLYWTSIWNNPMSGSAITTAKLVNGKLKVTGNRAGFVAMARVPDGAFKSSGPHGLAHAKKTYKLSSKCKFYKSGTWTMKSYKNGKVKYVPKFKGRISKKAVMKLLKKANKKVIYNKKTKRYKNDHLYHLQFQMKKGKVVKLSVYKMW